MEVALELDAAGLGGGKGGPLALSAPRHGDILGNGVLAVHDAEDVEVVDDLALIIEGDAPLLADPDGEGVGLEEATPSDLLAHHGEDSLGAGRGCNLGWRWRGRWRCPHQPLATGPLV